ncbi:MAG: hypothetical protein ACK4TC_18025 [Sphingomonas pseudosanguinis]|uniref:hypothetical protein n=1 Tax=Sphingomonas pseudosanguinis TaxID=413712 RepID=UPI003918997E
MTEPPLTNWRHYEIRQSGECTVFDDGNEKLVAVDMGIVETGRSRVFAGYFFRVRLADDEQITAEDGGSMIAALWRLARNLSARGLHLQCAGMSGKWRESGLSQNTGWGYYGPQQQPMHMLDDMPEDGGDETLDRAIREAVDGMKIGLA